MLNPDAVDEIATKLVPENFFRPAHQLIYAGILELNTRHIPIDQISLADRLAAEGQLEAVGGRPYSWSSLPTTRLLLPIGRTILKS